MKKRSFEVLSAGAMRKKYRLTAESARRPVALDPERVPEDLRHLIPYAERWGITDDLMLEDVLSKAPPPEIADLKRVVGENEDRLEQWLAGPEAKGPTFTKEYVAFSALLLAADLA